MSVSKMERLTVLVPRARVDELLSRLARLRLLHLTDTPCEMEGLHGMAEHADVAGAMERAARVDAVLPELASRAPVKPPRFAPLIRVRRADFRTDGRMDVAWQVVEEAERTIARRDEAIADRAAALEKRRAYAPYLAWDGLLDFEGTESTSWMLGAFPAKVTRETVTGALANRAAMVQVVREDATGLYVAVVMHRSEKELTVRVLEDLGFKAAELPRVHSLVKAVYDEAGRDCADIDAKLVRYARRLDSLAERVREVRILSDVVNADLERERRKERLAATESCAVLTGFCPVDARDRVERVLESMDAAFEFSAPESTDEIPVYLHQPQLVKAFAPMFGTRTCPVFARFDPTLLLCALYCLMFGAMFADVGYGAVLAVAAFLCAHFLRMPVKLRQLLYVLGCCGVVSAVLGLLIGSYFGTLPGLIFSNMPSLALLPSVLARAITRVSPVYEPLAPIAVALLLCALHLAIGMILEIVRLCRTHRALEALLDVAPRLLLLAGLVILPFLPLVGAIVALCALIAIPVAGGRGEKSFGAWLCRGLRAFLALKRYAILLLTFQRTLALGLAGSALGFLFVGIFRMPDAPFLPLLLSILVFAAAYMILYAMDLLLAIAHKRGEPYADVLGVFHDSANPTFDPMTPTGRYTEDVTPADSNLL